MWYHLRISLLPRELFRPKLHIRITPPDDVVSAGIGPCFRLATENLEEIPVVNGEATTPSFKNVDQIFELEDNTKRASERESPGGEDIYPKTSGGLISSNSGKIEICHAFKLLEGFNYPP